MTLSLDVFSQLDPDAERKRALAKVYSLLIKLAEGVEVKTVVPDVPVVEVVEEESITESELVQLELMM
jgi:hypothetical protein